MSKLSGISTLYKKHNSGLKPINNTLGSSYYATSILSSVANTGGAAPVPPPPILYNIFGNATPAVIDSPDGGGYNMGVEFSSAIDGVAYGIRFYKSAANVGTHYGGIWGITSGAGSRLQLQAFTNETASGWQEMYFTNPVDIVAGRLYVATVSMAGGHYSKDANFFASNDFVNAPLTAYKNAGIHVNGRFASAGSDRTENFPNQSSGAANYWIDIILQDTTPTTGNTSLFNANVYPAMVDSLDNSETNISTIFKSTVGGTITKIKFFKSAANTGTHIGYLRNMAGTALGTVTFTGETASGWQEATFLTPVPITANTQYMAHVYCPVGRYSKTAEFFGAGAFSRLPLIAVAPADAANGHGNGQYAYGNATTVPNATFQNSCYFVDVVFSP